MDRSSLFAKLQTDGKFMSKNNQTEKALCAAALCWRRKKKKEKKRKRNAGVSLDAKFNIDWRRCLRRLPPPLPPIDGRVSSHLPS